jgi:hypothetical protein
MLNLSCSTNAAYSTVCLIIKYLLCAALVM